MSTTNLAVTGLSTQDPKGGNVGGTPAALGLPDSAVIAQLANQLYAALPGRPTIPGIAADAQAAAPTSALPVAPPLGPEGEFGSLPIASYVPPTSGISPPSDAELRPVPASLASVGGAPSPATAASPPSESSYYFLDPIQAALPGIVVDLAPSATSRLDSGSLATSPSPPSAISQPAEPNLRSLPGMLSGVAGLAPGSVDAAPAASPFTFRPELAPFQATTPPSGAGATVPTTVPPATLPQEAGSLPPAAAAPPAAALAPSAEEGPRALMGTPGLPLQAATRSGSSFYFLDDIQPAAPSDATDFHSEPYNLPVGIPGLEFATYPFDSRDAASEVATLPEPAILDATSRQPPVAADPLTTLAVQALG